MAIVHLFCRESTGLTLGPGDKYGPRVIQFTDHYADLDTEAPDYAERLSWVNSPGCPPIEIVATVNIPPKAPTVIVHPAPTFRTPTVADGWHQYR
jgi:hypothetical protein